MRLNMNEFDALIQLSEKVARGNVSSSDRVELERIAGSLGIKDPRAQRSFGFFQATSSADRPSQGNDFS